MATGYVGERVRWLGPPQRTGFITPAYWAAVDAGEQRQPTPAERPPLATGEHGTVTELLRVDEAGYHTCVIVFDGGHELEAMLPAPTLIELVNHTGPAGPAGPTRRRYVPAAARRRTPLGQLLHGCLRAMRLTTDPR